MAFAGKTATAEARHYDDVQGTRRKRAAHLGLCGGKRRPTRCLLGLNAKGVPRRLSARIHSETNKRIAMCCISTGWIEDDSRWDCLQLAVSA